MSVVTAQFIDPIRGERCALIVPSNGRCYPSDDETKIGVRHPGCAELADLTVELDCFYCRSCGWNGRISGAWAMDVIEEAKQFWTPEDFTTPADSNSPDAGDTR